MDRRGFITGAVSGLILPGQFNPADFMDRNAAVDTEPTPPAKPDTVSHSQIQRLLKDVRELQQWRARHAGIDWASAGIYSPHPNQEIATAVINKLRVGDNIWASGKIPATGDSPLEPWSPGLAMSLGASGITDAFVLRWFENLAASSGDEVYIYGSRVSGDPYLYLYVKEDSGNGSGRIEVGDTTSAGYVSLAAAGGGVTYEFIVFSGGLLLTKNGVDQGAFTLQGDFSTLTIAAGVVTITTGAHTIDTQGGAGTDDLDTINGGTTGQVLILKAADNARTVVAKDGAGNLRLAGDCTLDNVEDTITLIYSGSAWLETARSNNGA